MLLIYWLTFFVQWCFRGQFCYVVIIGKHCKCSHRRFIPVELIQIKGCFWANSIDIFQSESEKNTSIRTENDLFQQQQLPWAVRSLNRWNFKIHVFENRAIDSSNKRVISFYPNRKFRAWVFKCGLVFISSHMFAHNK